MWSPGSHIAISLLAARRSSLAAGSAVERHLRPEHLRHDHGSAIAAIRTAGELDSDSGFALNSAELQHIWETPRYSLIAGRPLAKPDDVEFAPGWIAPLIRFRPRWMAVRIETAATHPRVTRRGVWAEVAASSSGGASCDHRNFRANADLRRRWRNGNGRAANKPTTEARPAAVLLWERDLLRASLPRKNRWSGLCARNEAACGWSRQQVAGFKPDVPAAPDSREHRRTGAGEREFETAGVGF